MKTALREPMEPYAPPYEITEGMLALLSDISEEIGRMDGSGLLSMLPGLRDASRISSVLSSLAIEGHALSLEKARAIFEGRRVLAPLEDVLAMENAFAAYRMLPGLDPFSLDDLKKAHGTMMKGLVREAGRFRSGPVGVFDGEGRPVHVAPPPERVKALAEELFRWLRGSALHMLVRSSVLHYELEFIHLFQDGNGRMGRLWQTALLASWKPIFLWVPVESIVHDRQEEYYQAIARSTREGKSNPFILFMLSSIKEAVLGLQKEARKHLSHLSRQVQALLSVMETFPMSASELMDKLGLKSRATFLKNYLRPALEAGLISMTDPGSPRSPRQRYFKA